MKARRFVCVFTIILVAAGLGCSSTSIAQEADEDTIDECDPRVLTVDARENGTQILAEITLEETTPIADIVASPAPCSRLLRFYNAGHGVIFEEADAVNEALRNHVARHDGPDGQIVRPVERLSRS